MARYKNEFDLVDKVIDKVGKKIILGTPLGAGKPNHILNAFYQKALNDPSIQLTICTALTLQRPNGKSDLEKRFLGPMDKRVFKDYPDLDYELARMSDSLPANIEVIEFYFPAGKFLNNPKAQQNYISSNYTHVVRDMLDRNINVLAQLICEKEIDGAKYHSLSSNPDVTTDMAAQLKDRDYPVAMVAQINQNLPFMYGDAVVKDDFFEFIMDDPEKYFCIFGPPKMSVSDADYMIGLYCSALIKDDGELQIGIGSLGDSTVYGLLKRHQQNDVYQELLKDLKVMEKFGDTIERFGGTAPFDTGLFGATEMLVDGFMHLYKAGIIKKKVYDDIKLQRLLNAGLIKEEFEDDILEVLLKHKVIHERLTEADFNYLQHWGILNETVRFKNGHLQINAHHSVLPYISDPANLAFIKGQCLGNALKNGQVLHGGFFLGPQEFYDWLRDLPEEEKKLINMKSVQKINQLYGHETLDRLHRKNARFVNSCMMTTLAGAAVSDGLEDGRVVSGVGGQYNFVAMAQELPDGNSVLNLRATRTQNGKTISSIVPFYGHITIPRHLRDIVVTEYGIAFLRGKTDQEIIKALLNITDSRFQDQLLQWAKSVKKIEADYSIPELYRNNTPASYQQVLKKYKARSLFQPFPFGTDLDESEIALGKALKSLKKDLASKPALLKNLWKGTFAKKGEREQALLERMGLGEPKGMKEQIYANLLLSKLV